jgi:hypothetical protein
MEISSANKYLLLILSTDKQWHLNAILNFRASVFKAGPAPILITNIILLALFNKSSLVFSKISFCY